jgi:hypothetical protein
MMAPQQLIRNYLAYWFHLGKSVIIRNGEMVCRPVPVMRGSAYSPEFEQCWAEIMVTEGRNCYLAGTTETLDQLMSNAWEIVECARCQMPVPIPTVAHATHLCPCNDLPLWPNAEIPSPHLPIDNQVHLSRLRSSLDQGTE